MPEQQTTEPIAPAAPVEPVQPAAVAPETPPAPEAPTGNVWDDPAAARAEIEKLRRENGSARVNAKQQAADEAKQAYAQQIGKILGLVADDAVADPAKLTEQLTTTQTEAQQARLELAVYKAAAAAKADPAALLDSRAFLTKAAGIDPTDTAALAAAISEATTSNPRFKVSQAATVGGADLGAGGSAPARTYTRAMLADSAFYQANKSDILAAQREGRITS